MADLSPRMRGFLEHYGQCGDVSESARRVGVTRTAHYRALERSELYRGEFEKAKREYAKNVEKIRDRFAALVPTALEVVENHLTKLAAGQSSSLERSDVMILKDVFDRAGLKPELKVEHSGKAGGPLVVEVRSYLDKPEEA